MPPAFRRGILPLLVNLCLSLLLESCGTGDAIDVNREGEPMIRVCIAQRSGEVELFSGGDFVIESLSRRERIADSTRIVVSASSKGAINVRAGTQRIDEAGGNIRMYSSAATHRFEFENKRYHDTITIAGDGASLHIINALPMEEYLRCVVPNEIGKNRGEDEFEAVKAQAILARTYAMQKIALPLRRLFDVYSDTRDQVYNGSADRAAITDRAVAATRGRVLQFDGKPAECYFHSTCGGRTEAVSLVWKRPQSKPYLAGIADSHGGGDYCRISPSYRWTESYTRRELEPILRVWLASAVETFRASDFPESGWYLLDVRILKRMPSGRVATLKIVIGNRTEKKTITVEADDIRRALRRPDGSGILRSTLFDLTIDRDENRWIRSVRIDGGGSGHGIGLCQWGAIARARKGWSAAAILNAYFPGTEIDRLY
jgi:stage II sporulation protein D